MMNIPFNENHPRFIVERRAVSYNSLLRKKKKKEKKKKDAKINQKRDRRE